MAKKITIPKGSGGRPPLFAYNTLKVGQGHFIKGAKDTLRNNVSQYASRHDITLVCRVTYEKGKRTGITVWREA